MSTIRRTSIENADKFVLKNRQWGSDTYNVPVYAQLSYDEEGITVRFTVEESDPLREKTEHFDNVCLDSCVEFFVNFMPRQSDQYMNFEVNALGVMNSSCRRKGDKPTRFLLEELEGLCIMPVIEEKQWTVTYKIGFDLIRKYYPGFEPDRTEYVKCNFYKCGGEGEDRHFLTCFKVGTERPDFHRPEYFGRVEVQKMEKHYEFREKLREIHRPDRVNDAVWKQIEGQVIDETWTIGISPEAGIVVRNAAKDLQKYFAVSMKLQLAIVSCVENRQIRLQVSLTSSESLYRVAVEEGNILLDGTDERMTAQAVYALEDQMNMNEGPVLRLQDQVYSPLFATRIIDSGVGEDMYPDEHLCAIAHAGINGITLDTRGVTEKDEIKDRVNGTIARAAAFGIDVYTFPVFKNQRHPSDADAREHYDRMYGELFRRCPGLKGVILVGEVCEFPSHDARTTGKTWRESLQDEKSSPGWFPCNDYPQFVTLLRDVIHSVKPEARFIFWSYNWGYVDTDLRVALIDAMPAQGVTLMATYEMFEKFRPRPGVEENCVDYTLFFEGPGEYFSTELEAASRRNIEFMAMSNTGGNTWDLGMVPYLPAPGQWIRRYENIVADRLKYPNFTSLRESHSYGYWPSFIPELTKAAFTEPRQDLNALLRAIAVRDYGAENADTVLEAWEHFSEGMCHCVPTNEEQYGPCRVGPAYPLYFEKWEPLPIGPESERNPNWTCCSVYRFNPDEMERLIYETEEYEKMTAEFEAGNRLLSDVIPGMSESKKKYAREALMVSRFIENTARTTVHVKRWHKAKIHLGIYVDHEAIWPGGRHGMSDALSPVKPLEVRPDRKNWIRELIAVGEAEIQNAKDTIPLVQANSRLGYTQELDYACSEEQLLWKIDRLERTLEEEVQPMLAEASNEF